MRNTIFTFVTAFATFICLQVVAQHKKIQFVDKDTKQPITAGTEFKICPCNDLANCNTLTTDKDGVIHYLPLKKGVTSVVAYTTTKSEHLYDVLDVLTGTCTSLEKGGITIIKVKKKTNAVDNTYFQGMLEIEINKNKELKKDYDAVTHELKIKGKENKKLKQKADEFEKKYEIASDTIVKYKAEKELTEKLFNAKMKSVEQMRDELKKQFEEYKRDAAKALGDVVDNVYIEVRDIHCEGFDSKNNTLTFSFKIYNTEKNEFTKENYELKMKLMRVNKQGSTLAEDPIIDTEGEKFVVFTTYRHQDPNDKTIIRYTFKAHKSVDFQTFFDKNDKFFIVLYNYNLKGTTLPINDLTKPGSEYQYLKEVCKLSNNIETIPYTGKYSFKSLTETIKIQIKDKEGSKNQDIIKIAFNGNDIFPNFVLSKDYQVLDYNFVINSQKNYLHIYLLDAKGYPDCGVEIIINDQHYEGKVSKDLPYVILLEQK